MVDAFNLVDDGVKGGVSLTEDACAGEVLNGGRVLICGAGVDHHCVDCLLVGVGEVDGLTALGGVHHAGDDAVDLACVKRGDKAVPVHLHDDQFKAECIRNDAGDLYVVALCVCAGDVFNGNIGVACFALLPVGGGVSALHTDAELTVVGSEGIVCGGFGCCGGGGGCGCGAAAGAECECHNKCQKDGSNSSHHFAVPHFFLDYILNTACKRKARILCLRGEGIKKEP